MRKGVASSPWKLVECLSSIFRRVWFREMLLWLLSAPRIIQIVDNFEGKSNVSVFLGKI